MRQRSKEYLLDKQSFNNELCISESLYKKGFHLAATNSFNYVHGEEKSNGEMEFFVFKSSISKQITMEYVNTFRKRKYKNFEQFAKESHGKLHFLNFVTQPKGLLWLLLPTTMNHCSRDSH